MLVVVTIGTQFDNTSKMVAAQTLSYPKLLCAKEWSGYVRLRYAAHALCLISVRNNDYLWGLQGCDRQRARTAQGHLTSKD